MWLILCRLRDTSGALGLYFIYFTMFVNSTYVVADTQFRKLYRYDIPLDKLFFREWLIVIISFRKLYGTSRGPTTVPSPLGRCPTLMG